MFVGVVDIILGMWVVASTGSERTGLEGLERSRLSVWFGSGSNHDQRTSKMTKFGRQTLDASGSDTTNHEYRGS